MRAIFLEVLQGLSEFFHRMRAIFLGALQGLSEFFPISSSGHLKILEYLMGLKLPLAFDIYLHLATVLVILIYYRKVIIELFLTLFKLAFAKNYSLSLISEKENLKYILLIFFITFVSGILGLFFRIFVSSLSNKIVFINFLFTAIMLIFIDRELLKFNLSKNIFLSALFIGIAQGIGTLPGISRSGITIFMASILGFERKKAAEISFLSLIPLVMGAVILDIKDLFRDEIEFSFLEINLGFITAFLLGLLSINLLLKYIEGRKLYLFALYLISISILGLIFIS